MIKKIVLSVLLLVSILYLSVAWYFSTEILMLPVDTKCTEKRFIFCGPPSEQGISYEDVTYTATDGLILPAWYMPSGDKNNDKAILLVHGRTADRTEGMRYVKAIHQAGYNILAIDLRHPRQDPSIISTMSYHEQKDVIGALNYLTNDKGMNTVGVMGFSMGAATSIIVMAQDKRIKAGIFSGGYANSMDVLSEQAKKLYGLPRYPLMPMVELFFSWRGNVDLDEINPEKYIAQISPRPIFIMHGTADQTVGYQHAERLYSKAKMPKQLWKVEGGKHTRLWQFDPQTADEKVTSFFNQYLKN